MTDYADVKEFHAKVAELRIHQAAIREGDEVYTLSRPARHHDIIKHMVESGVPAPVTGEQGFIDSSGRFLNRRQAAMVAHAAGQLPRDGLAHPPELYTEDLW